MFWHVCPFLNRIFNFNFCLNLPLDDEASQKSEKQNTKCTAASGYQVKTNEMYLNYVFSNALSVVTHIGGWSEPEGAGWHEYRVVGVRLMPVGTVVIL